MTREVTFIGFHESLLLAALDEAHPHPRGLARDLAGEPLGTGPRLEAPVIVVGVWLLLITMRAPTILIFGASEFGAAARLWPAGESTRIIRLPAVARRGQNIASPDLVAEEMR